MNKTFAELFCAAHGLPPERFASAFLRLAYYPHAAAMPSLTRLLSPAGLALDHELVRWVGLITRREELPGLLSDFRLDSRNRGFARSRLRLRISTRRVRNLVYCLMPSEPADPTVDSRSPVEGGAGG